MPVYAYKGFDRAGKNVTGTQYADSPRSIKAVLRKEGIFITELKESGQKARRADKKTPFANSLRERVSSRN